MHEPDVLDVRGLAQAVLVDVRGGLELVFKAGPGALHVARRGGFHLAAALRRANVPHAINVVVLPCATRASRWPLVGLVTLKLSAPGVHSRAMKWPNVRPCWSSQPRAASAASGAGPQAIESKIS